MLMKWAKVTEEVNTLARQNLALTCYLTQGEYIAPPKKELAYGALMGGRVTMVISILSLRRLLFEVVEGGGGVGVECEGVQQSCCEGSHGGAEVVERARVSPRGKGNSLCCQERRPGDVEVAERE